MGVVCFPCLPMKVISYITLAVDNKVVVEKITSDAYSKCDICKNNMGAFILTYIPKDKNDSGNQKCWAIIDYHITAKPIPPETGRK